MHIAHVKSYLRSQKSFLNHPLCTWTKLSSLMVNDRWQIMHTYIHTYTPVSRSNQNDSNPIFPCGEPRAKASISSSGAHVLNGSAIFFIWVTFACSCWMETLPVKHNCFMINNESWSCHRWYQLWIEEVDWNVEISPSIVTIATIQHECNIHSTPMQIKSNFKKQFTDVT